MPYSRYTDEYYAWGHDAWDSDSDEEDRLEMEERKREYCFIKFFDASERKAKGVKMGFFPRMDFKLKAKGHFPDPDPFQSTEEVDVLRKVKFIDYTIWERLPHTLERQQYLDKWMEKYEKLVNESKEAGNYKAMPCLVHQVRTYGHHPDKCIYYHSEKDRDGEAEKKWKAVLAEKNQKHFDELRAYEEKLAAEQAERDRIAEEKLAEQRRQHEETLRRIELAQAKTDVILQQQYDLDAAVKAGSRKSRRRR